MSIETFMPAYPLITIDPYLSIWSTTDHPAKSDTTHWAGSRKRLTLCAAVDGSSYALIGRQFMPPAELKSRKVTPTRTEYVFSADGADIAVSFRAPLLLNDLDLMSMPVNMLDISAVSCDGAQHAVTVELTWHDDICRDGDKPVPMLGQDYKTDELELAWMGQRRQALLCHSGDHITIDWGYAYLEGCGARFVSKGGHWALYAKKELCAGAAADSWNLLLAYNDVASIQYFDYTARAYYTRNGRTIIDAIKYIKTNRTELNAKLDALDADICSTALAAGGENYVKLVCAAYRHSICAHKLIADQEGKPVFISKENDSNGCAATVDVSYPSIPLYLAFNPELVCAMCRPIFKFAKMPIWQFDFAPHDAGRYPYLTGQVYALARTMQGQGVEATSINADICDTYELGDVFAPLYLYDGSKSMYNFHNQMPVEESGNMIIMLAAAFKADGDCELIKQNLPLLKTWVKYLEQYGEDPGEQLCTDDFAGHLARNVNLAIKAVCGLAAYGWIMEQLGDKEQADYYKAESKRMAQSIIAHSDTPEGTTLTLEGTGWSLKYNAVWDELFGFELFAPEFYTKEFARYRKETNEYGVPLDSRSVQTKSDWIMWTAAMADAATVNEFAAPMVTYMKETPTRVPFSDWYNTVNARYYHFIGRSVQGGIFMPYLKYQWSKR